MTNIYNNTPIAFPWYQDIKDQNINKENSNGEILYKLITPATQMLPFQIEMPTDKPHPTKWEIYGTDGETSELIYDLQPSMNMIRVYKYLDRHVAVYPGGSLKVKYKGGVVNLVMPCGYYYSKITFADGSYYVSEIFFAENNTENYMRVMFWCDNDLKPITYRDEWKQVLYLDTFVHTAAPEVEEETITDGDKNEIPTWQKMVLKYKFVDTVPDFLKIALVSLQIHEFVYLWISESRQGYVDRVFVSETPDETGAMSDVEVTFEDDMMIRRTCPINDNLLGIETW